MAVNESNKLFAWRARVCALCLLALFGLSGCGSSEQSASPPTSVESPDQLTSNAIDQGLPSAMSTPSPPTSQATAGAIVAPNSTAMPAPIATLVPTQSPPAPLPASATVLPSSAPSAAGWQTYRSDAGGYRVDYPSNWTVSDRSSAGNLTSTFRSADGKAGIELRVQPGQVAPKNTDLPNVRCSAFTIGGMNGSRCFDTLAFSTVVTLSAGDKTYTIIASGKRLDQTIFQHFLDSFTLLP